MNFQRFLDGIVDAFESRDFEAFESRIGLPLTVFSYEGTALVARIGDLRHYFEAYVSKLEALGVTEHRRVATSFFEIGPALASCTYETLYLRNGSPVVPPFSSASTLRLIDGGWRVVSLMSSIPQARSWFQRHAIDVEAARSLVRGPVSNHGLA